MRRTAGRGCWVGMGLLKGETGRAGVQFAAERLPCIDGTNYTCIKPRFCAQPRPQSSPGIPTSPTLRCSMSDDMLAVVRLQHPNKK